MIMRDSTTNRVPLLTTITSHASAMGNSSLPELRGEALVLVLGKASFRYLRHRLQSWQLHFVQIIGIVYPNQASMRRERTSLFLSRPFSSTNSLPTSSLDLIDDRWKMCYLLWISLTRRTNLRYQFLVRWKNWCYSNVWVFIPEMLQLGLWSEAQPFHTQSSD